MYNSRNYVRSWHDTLECNEIQLKVCLNWLLGEHLKGKSAHNFLIKILQISIEPSRMTMSRNFHVLVFSSELVGVHESSQAPLLRT